MKHVGLSELNLSELARVQRTLERRYRIRKGGNIVQIGFGIAEKNNALDWERSQAICFYVSRKTKTFPRRKTDRITPTIKIRLRRQNRFCQLVAFTDVIQATRRDLCLTGKTIRFKNQSSAMTGALLSWGGLRPETSNWGVLSVGHTFPRTGNPLGSPGNWEPDVLIDGNLPGQFLAQGSSAALDLSVTLVRYQDLVDRKWLAEDYLFSEHPVAVRTIDQLWQDVGQTGLSWTSVGTVPFVVKRFLLRAPLFQSLLGFAPRDVLHVQSQSSVFGPGTSGNAWTIQNDFACVQFGAFAPVFSEGFGQSVMRSLNWVRRTIARSQALDESILELRIGPLF